MPDDRQTQRELDLLRSQAQREIDQLRGDIRQLHQRIDSTQRLLTDKISSMAKELHERIDAVPEDHVTQSEWAAYKKAIWLIVTTAVALLLGFIGLKSGKLPPL